MRHPEHAFVVGLLIFSALVPFAAAVENWPGWRGPRGDGSSEDSSVPLQWTVPEDVKWKVALPGGHASPIIWEDRIYAVSATEEDQSRELLCLDRKTGAEIWRRTVLEAPFEGIHRLNSHASSTPVTDGERIFVSFLDEDQMYIAGYDPDGNRLWEQRPGPFASKHGYCSSPILWKDMLIINGDHDGDGFLVALDQKTGEIVWEVDRPNNTRSYCTPIIRQLDGRNQLILSGTECITSYDPDNGDLHWIIDGPTEQYVASLVYNPAADLLFMTCGFPERHIMAIRPDGSGNVTHTHVEWHETVGASYVPSPISIGDYFLLVADNGVASCFNAASGERLWRERLPGAHSASIVSVDGHAVFISDEGIMSVLKPGPEFEILYSSELGEKVSASPAIHNGQWFIRGHHHLYCIGQP